MIILTSTLSFIDGVPKLAPMSNTPPKALGHVQRSVLRCLAEHSGTWHPGCGWYWDTASGTVRILNSLIKHGLVTRIETPSTVHAQRTFTEWRITDAGRSELNGRGR